jgi:putative acetyltransferase
MRIEPEAPDVVRAIGDLLRAAFPSHVEADLVDRLRRDGDLAIALAAIDDGAVVGYVAFSPMAAPFRALGLGPLAVAPARQRSGIGSRLVREGLARARRGGWEAVFVLGDPAYYGRFGFDAAAARGFASPYAGPHFLAHALGEAGLPASAGSIAYAPAFRDLE